MNLLVKSIPAAAIALYGAVATAQTTLLKTDFDSLEAGNATAAELNSITTGGTWAINPARDGFLSITLSGTMVRVGFKGTDGQTYNLNKSTNLGFATPDIRDTEMLCGIDTGTLTDNSTTKGAAFYQVEQQP